MKLHFSAALAALAIAGLVSTGAAPVLSTPAFAQATPAKPAAPAKAATAKAKKADKVAKTPAKAKKVKKAKAPSKDKPKKAG